MKPVRTARVLALDAVDITASAIGVVITITLSYYSFRTIRLFKHSVAARAWIYISLSGIFFSLGVTTFLVSNLIQDTSLIILGGAIDLLGGALLLLGLRKNYLFWSSQDHFM